MPTSGTYSYGVTAGQIGTAVGENLGLLGAGGTLASSDLATILQRLNFVAKQWQGHSDMAQGLKIHTRQRLTLFLAKGQQKYTIGPAATDARCTAQYGRTTISADEAAAQTVISITSNTDTTTYPGTTVTMTNADIVGIELNDGTIQWTTISGTPAATMTIGVALTGPARAGNYVWWFTSRAQRFPVLEYAVLQDENRSDLPLYVYRDVQEYESLTDKRGLGDPMCVLVEPGRINTALTFDALPQDVTKVVNLTVLYPAEDYAAASNDIAFPQEWFAALEWEVTLRVAPSFGVEWTPTMEKNYQNATSMARQVNEANSSLSFEPGRE